MEFLYKKFSLDNNIQVVGLTQELNVLYILNKFNKAKENILVVTSSLYECNKIFSLLSTYIEDVLIFPLDDFISTMALATSPDLKVKRLETLKKINQGKHIIITNLNGYLKYLSALNENISNISLKVNQKITRDTVIDNLEKLGYSRDTLVTSTGMYAVRGFILDVFLIDEEHPIRIEFFGDNIDSIRYFDENTQLTINKINEITLYPYNEIISEKKSSLFDYLNNPIVFYIDYQQIMASYDKLSNDIIEYKDHNDLNKDEKYMFNFEDIKPQKEIFLNNINNISNIKLPIVKYNSYELENFNGNFDLLSRKIESFMAHGKTVVFCLSNKNQVEDIENKFETVICSDNYIKNKINICNFRINKGFILDDIMFISEFDIEINSVKTIKYKNSLKIGKKLNSLNNLNLGDYVVHRTHGIGIYNGVVTISQRGIKKDYLQINYLGNDKVYIPVEKINTIYKYNDNDGLKPKINKLNSISWELKKRSAEKRIKDISEELMKLYAIRKNTKRKKYIDNPMEDVFASLFPYKETKDQLKAIQDIEDDLRSEVPMDRLLCGDVGFGKTEVAFRAIFKTVLNNEQVLYLCPTTILSKQQYNSALSRFKEYPLNIALLNRFATLKETKQILNDLEKGKIDILFGTHRLLSNDVKCKNLGLLIVDEEQRFGVTHKEKIKSFRNDVNVLTLSATPIPRTLKMAMSGLRDLSVIDTAPVNRYPVQTYVLSEDDLIIKDAIYKELSRNGQIFVLYNRVSLIEEFANRLNRLVPEAKINFAHGQMTKKELDDIMESFINYDFDILVCTTIIETGIDIPNANTLIIYDADHFGLSQLYQLRGRVGRSDRIAYAYLLYDKKKVLNDVAVKRLQAIKDFTELGSGYRIAMRDLSLRGAGDILGSEQAGFVDSIGLSLYMKMIEEEIKKLNGEKIEDEEEDSNSLINVETHISDDYVSDEDIKIEIHQLINEVKDKESLNKIKGILEDRFGKINDTLEIYMMEEWFSQIALKLNIKNVLQTDKYIEIELPESISNNIKGDKLFLESYSINPNFSFRYIRKKIIIKLILKSNDKHFLYYIVPLLENIYNDISNEE